MLAPVDGVPLAVVTARALIAGTGDALAVVREGDELLARALREAGCEVLASDACPRGMGASLAAAVKASRSAGGWLVALGDMPGIRPGTYAAVKRALAEGAVVAAAVDEATGRRGHPVAFAGSLGDELARLDGDEGAKGLIARHAPRFVAVPVADPGIFRDVDTPADLAAVPVGAARP
jgi:molybdenum cofactor cytidylyltransferase